MLTSRDLSLLVIDNLCDRDGGWNVAIASYYLGFVAQKQTVSNEYACTV